MAISIQIPTEIELELRAKDPQLDAHARDEFLLTSYRAGRVSTSDIAEVLGLDSRFAAERWLADQWGVPELFAR